MISFKNGFERAAPFWHSLNINFSRESQKVKTTLLGFQNGVELLCTTEITGGELQRQTKVIRRRKISVRHNQQEVPL